MMSAIATHFVDAEHFMVGGSTLSTWAVGAIVLAGWLIVLFFAKSLIFFLIRRAAQRAHWEAADHVIGPLSTALNILILVSGIAIAADICPIPPAWHGVVNTIVVGGLIAALTVFVDQVLRMWMHRAASRFPVLSDSYGLVTGGLRGIIVGLGILMFLESIGISISPILASLGIGSLAVALALQDTLKNMFSGFFVIADKPVQVGDFVRLESGQEGWLVKLGWRSSQFRTTNQTTVVIPNSKLADSVLTNFRTLDGAIVIPIDLRVESTADLDKIARVAAEVARDVMKTVDGGIARDAPLVRFSSVDPGAAAFTIALHITLHASSGAAIDLIRHEFIRRVAGRFNSEGIKLA